MSLFVILFQTIKNKRGRFTEKKMDKKKKGIISLSFFYSTLKI